MPLKQLSSARRPDSFDPRSVPGLALWLDGADTSTLYTTDAGPVTAVTAPTDISGCVGWWDASDAATLFAADTGSTLATTTVGRWANKGTLGSAADLLQASAGSRPAINTATRNGLRVMSFDGVDDWMQRAFTLSQPCTVLMAFSYTSTFAATTTLCDGAGNGNTLRFAPTSETSALFNTGGNTPQLTLTAWGAMSQWQTACLIANGAASASACFRSGLSTVGGLGATATATQPNGLTLASWGAFGLQYAGVMIAEVVAFNSALAITDRARVEAYLATRWGIANVHAQATATSDPVGHWRDKSGNGRNVIQSVGSARPSLRAATINGKRSVDFDGVDDTLWVTPSVTSGDLTALCVYRYDTLNGGVVYDVAHQGDSTNAQRSESTGFLNSIGMLVSAAGLVTHRLDRIRSFVETQGGRSSVAGAYSAGRVALSSAAASHETNTDRYGGLDGASLTQTTRFNGGAWSAISIGARRNSTPVSVGSVFLDGQVCEFLLYERNLSQSQRQRIEQYLAAKWGITLSPQVANADAQDWINRVYANGGQVSSSTASAVNTLCNSIDAAGIRDRFYRMGIFAGSNLAAALVPLYRGQSLGGTQFGNATDTNVGPFVSGDYVETGASGGLTGNGSTKYLQTGIAPSAWMAANGGSHMAVYKCTSTNSGVLISSRYNPANTALWQNWEYGAGGNAAGGSTGAFGSPGSHNSLLGVTRGAGGSAIPVRSFRNDAFSADNSGGNDPAGTSVPVAVFARNGQSSDTNAYTMNLFTNQRLAAYSVGLSLSAAQLSAYNTAMQAFQASLGRNV